LNVFTYHPVLAGVTELSVVDVPGIIREVGELVRHRPHLAWQHCEAIVDVIALVLLLW